MRYSVLRLGHLAALPLLLLLSACMRLASQNQVIFEPVRLPADYVFALPPLTRELWVEVAPGVRLDALYCRQPAQSRGLLLYFPGNAKNLQNWLDVHAPAVLGWGYDVLVADYRGFGKSGGRLQGEAQLYADAEKLYAQALALGYRPEQVVLYGYSMGTAMAAHLATVRPARALVLESPYSSIDEIEWVKHQAPAYPLNTAAKAPRLALPTLIVHGTADDVITADHAQRIFDRLPAATPKKLVLVPGGGHGNLRQRPEYRRLLTQFLDHPDQPSPR